MESASKYGTLRLAALLFFLGFVGFIAIGQLLFGWFFSAPTQPAASEVEMVVETARDTFWQERNYDESIRLLNEQLASADGELLLAEEATLKNELASAYLRNEQEKGLALFAEVFNDSRYPVDARAAALLNTMWHVSSHVGDSSLSVEQVNEMVFAPSRFGDALGIVDAEREVLTSLEVRARTVDGFKMVLDMSDSRRIRMFARSFIARYLAHVEAVGGSANRTTIVDEILDQANRSMLEIKDKASRSKETNEYDQYIPTALYNLQRAYGFLHQMGYAVYPEASEVNDLLLDYASVFRDQDYFNGILLAEAGMRFVCVMVEEADYQVGNIDTDKVKRLLQYSYDLPAEDKERRRGIALIAEEQDSHPCFKPLVFVATTVDEHLQSFLVDDVGTWTNEHFQ